MRFMYILLIATLAGCAVHIAAGGGRDEIRFSFDRSVDLRSLDVFEIEGGQRGRLACRLQPLAHARAELDAWTYGRDVDGTHKVVQCEPLVPGRLYGAMAYLPGHNEIMTCFQIQQDGSVIDLGLRPQ